MRLYSLSQVLNNVRKVIEGSRDKTKHNSPLRAVYVLNTVILELKLKKTGLADTHLCVCVCFFFKFKHVDLKIETSILRTVLVSPLKQQYSSAENENWKEIYGKSKIRMVKQMTGRHNSLHAHTHTRARTHTHTHRGASDESEQYGRCSLISQGVM